jgi:hypothetical protein
MFKRRTHIAITQIWSDDDLIELLVKADNGIFSGQTRVYTTPSEILKLAEVMSGFPKKIGDQNSCTLGEQDVYGQANFQLSSIDGKGHCELSIQFQGTVGFEDEEGKATVIFRVDPSEIDRITGQIESLGKGITEQVEYQGPVA